jgi:hypothetical protein
MPPFDETPPGFRPESLELLDIAMTKLWLEQVAIGATQSGASPEVRNSVNTSIRLLKERGTQRRKRSANSSETRMTSHRYKAGQDVFYHPPKGALVGPSRYRILRLLPLENGEVKYRIKSAGESFERVAKESELTR